MPPRALPGTPVLLPNAPPFRRRMCKVIRSIATGAAANPPRSTGRGQAIPIVLLSGAIPRRGAPQQAPLSWNLANVPARIRNSVAQPRFAMYSRSEWSLRPTPSIVVS